METKWGRTDVHTTDGWMDRWMDGHTHGQPENIIPRHKWRGIKSFFCFYCLNMDVNPIALRAVKTP